MHAKNVKNASTSVGMIFELKWLLLVESDGARCEQAETGQKTDSTRDGLRLASRSRVLGRRQTHQITGARVLWRTVLPDQ